MGRNRKTACARPPERQNAAARPLKQNITGVREGDCRGTGAGSASPHPRVRAALRTELGARNWRLVAIGALRWGYAGAPGRHPGAEVFTSPNFMNTRGLGVTDEAGEKKNVDKEIF